MITTRQLRYFTAYTLAGFGLPLVVLMNGCAIAPNINPGAHLVVRSYEAQLADHGDYTLDRYDLDDSYNPAVVERRKIQRAQRWRCIAFDYATTAGALALGGHELGGNITLAAKVPAGIALHVHGENVYDDTGDDSWVEADRIHCYAGWWNVGQIAIGVAVRGGL